MSLITKKIIKIPKKTFEDLSIEEVALMIEADSSISANGNDFFDSSALDVFLHNTELKREDLIGIRNEILSRIYVSKPGSSVRDVDTEFLRNFATMLRAKNSR